MSKCGGKWRQICLAKVETSSFGWHIHAQKFQRRLCSLFDFVNFSTFMVANVCKQVKDVLRRRGWYEVLTLLSIYEPDVLVVYQELERDV